MNIILILLTFLSTSIFAKNIVLLSSFENKDIKTEFKVDRITKKKLSLYENYNHNLIIIHKASVKHLYKYLNDPETMALFWIGHGGFKSTRGSQAIRPTPILSDHQKLNVAKAFQSVHPNIKFISIIGCNSFQILEGVLNHRDDLGYYIPTKKVLATLALRKSFRIFKRHFFSNRYEYISDDIQKQGIPVTVTRTVPNDSSALMIFAGKKLISLLPALKANESQSEIVYLPYKEGLKKYELKIVFATGQSAYDNTDNFGEIKVNHQDLSLWKLFSKANGEPFGVNERVFLFKNEIENLFIDYYVKYKSISEESL